MRHYTSDDELGEVRREEEAMFKFIYMDPRSSGIEGNLFYEEKKDEYE